MGSGIIIELHSYNYDGKHYQKRAEGMPTVVKEYFEVEFWRLDLGIGKYPLLILTF